VTPVGGTGMNTAVHAAHNLGWKLAWVLRGWAGDDLLDSYEAERRPVGARVTARSLPPRWPAPWESRSRSACPPAEAGGGAGPRSDRVEARGRIRRLARQTGGRPAPRIEGTLRTSREEIPVHRSTYESAARRLGGEWA
jgi:hypothetical protein